MTASLIGSDQSFLVWSARFALVAFGFWCEKFPRGWKFSGVMLMMGSAVCIGGPASATALA